MDTYVILRRGGWRTPEELQAAAERSRAEGDRMEEDIRWIRSYVLAEGSGGLGTVCVYQATNPDAIRRDWRRVAIRVAGIGRLVVGVGAVHGPAKGGPATGRNPTAREGAPASPKGLKARSPVRQRAGLPAPTPASAGFGLGQELGG